MEDTFRLLQRSATGSLTIFSALEARECLRNRTINIAGDSHTRMFYMGLVDILNGWERMKPTRMTGSQRKQIFRMYEEAFRKTLLPNGLRLRFVCWEECYDPSNVSICTDCFIKLSATTPSPDANVISFQIHTIEKLRQWFPTVYLDMFVEQLEELLKTVPYLIWGTGACYDPKYIPYPYNLTSQASDGRKLHSDLYSMVETSTQLRDLPILDFYTLTGACKWKNCSKDGGHRHWFVNRMKAQLFLNRVCQLERGIDNLYTATWIGV